LPWSLSIAHTPRAVLVALGRTPGVRVGVDLVEPVTLPRGFAEVWFTAAERRLLRDAQPSVAATLWAIKEAVYKAAGAGRPFAPRAIEVLPQQPCGFVSRPACALAVWRTPQGETAVVAHTLNHCVGGEEP
jgi:phosphopantetheinyl transferase